MESRPVWADSEVVVNAAPLPRALAREGVRLVLLFPPDLRLLSLLPPDLPAAEAGGADWRQCRS